MGKKQATSRKTRQQCVTNDALSLWTNQLKICPLVLTSNCTAPFGLISAILKMLQHSDAMHHSPMFCQSQRSCMLNCWCKLDRQEGDLINQTGNFITKMQQETLAWTVRAQSCRVEQRLYSHWWICLSVKIRYQPVSVTHCWYDRGADVKLLYQVEGCLLNVSEGADNFPSSIGGYVQKVAKSASISAQFAVFSIRVDSYNFWAKLLCWLNLAVTQTFSSKNILSAHISHHSYIHVMSYWVSMYHLKCCERALKQPS